LKKHDVSHAVNTTKQTLDLAHEGCFFGAPEFCHGLLEQNQNQCALTKRLKGGFFFHPSDEDLSPGTPAGKSHLAASLSGYSYSDFAISH
jgi:hypothetical protein